MIIELENTLVRREKKCLKSVYRLANEGRPLREVFQPLVVLRLKWGIIRLVQRIHIELKRVTSISGMTECTRHTHGLHLRNHTLGWIHVVQTIILTILTWDIIGGVVRVVVVVLGRRWRGRQRAPVVRQWKYRQRKKVDARRKRGLRLRTRKRGRRRRERRGFGNEYRGIDGLREIRRSARRFRWRAASS